MVQSAVARCPWHMGIVSRPKYNQATHDMCYKRSGTQQGRTAHVDAFHGLSCLLLSQLHYDHWAPPLPTHTCRGSFITAETVACDSCNCRRTCNSWCSRIVTRGSNPEPPAKPLTTDGRLSSIQPCCTTACPSIPTSECVRPLRDAAESPRPFGEFPIILLETRRTPFRLGRRLAPARAPGTPPHSPPPPLEMFVSISPTDDLDVRYGMAPRISPLSLTLEPRSTQRFPTSARCRMLILPVSSQNCSRGSRPRNGCGGSIIICFKWLFPPDMGEAPLGGRQREDVDEEGESGLRRLSP